MTEPDGQPQPGPQPDTRQLWELTIHAEAEVIPGDPADPEEDQ